MWDGKQFNTVIHTYIHTYGTVDRKSNVELLNGTISWFRLAFHSYRLVSLGH